MKDPKAKQEAQHGAQEGLRGAAHRIIRLQKDKIDGEEYERRFADLLSTPEFEELRKEVERIQKKGAAGK